MAAKRIGAMSELYEMSDVLLAEMAKLALPVDEVRFRARKRRLRRRVSIVGLGTLSFVILVVALVGTGKSDFVSNSQFTSFTTPGPPHLLDKEVKFGYLPSGFQLVSDERVNKTTTPADYLRTIVYQGNSAVGPAQVSLTIEQALSEQKLPQSLSSTSSAEYAFTSVRGHEALAVHYFDHVSGQVSTSYVNGQKHQSISCSGPVSAPRSQIDPICRTAFTAIKNQPQGPVFSNSHSLRNLYPATSLQWIERQGVMFTLLGEGLTLSVLRQVANGIAYNPSIGNCIVDGQSLGSGACAAGVSGSPPIDSTMVPAGGVELASGVVSGHHWALSADMQKGDFWVDLGYSGEFQNGKWFSSTRVSPTIALQTAENGQRFVFGLMPASVTSFRAQVQGSSAQQMKVLPAKLDGWSFFVLPLGKVRGTCNTACNSPVQLTFYSGGKSVYSSVWSSDATGEVSLH